MRVMLVLALIATSLAGCSDAPIPVDEPVLDGNAILDDAGRDLRTDLTAEDIIPKPNWEVGDWFGHHIFFGSSDLVGQHINVVVIEADSSGYYLVTDDPEIARFEAVIDVPIVGRMDSSTKTTAFGGPWEVYEFPMKDGKTWQGTLTIDQDVTHQLTYTATFEEDFKTQAGPRPGFKVIGVDGEGNTIVDTDYVPQLGWYTEMIVYDPTTDGDFTFRSLSMGTGEGWNGMYYEYDAELLLDDFGLMVAPDGQADPPMLQTITVPDTTTHAMWLQFCFAVAGQVEVTFVKPDNSRQRCGLVDVPPGADPNAWGGTGTGNFYTDENPAGDWHYTRSHNGFVAGGGTQFWALEEKTTTFSPS